MTAAAIAGPRTVETGLRRTDPSRDLAGVAQVIQAAFAGQLDPTGQRMLRDMRLVGRAGKIGWWLGRAFLPAGSTPDGYVWVEAGKVVGNLHLLPVDGEPHRWVIANVAVDPEQRRRGIGRSLVQAGMELARQRHGDAVVLQVDRSNHGARVLYESLGFRVTSTRTSWIRPRGLPRPQPIHLDGLGPRSYPEWREQWDLGQRVLPDGFWWPFLPDDRVFRGGGVPAALGMSSVHHWIWRSQGAVRASLSAQARFGAGFRFLMMVDEQHRGSVEGPLLARALVDLPEGSAGVLEYASGEAEAELWELGFRPDRSLTWMALDLRPRGAADDPGPEARVGA